jgi:hypothetical protein
MKKVDASVGKAVFLPESFEWLVLKSEIMQKKDVETILEEPSDFIESQEYMSWERFFTPYFVRGNCSY